MTFFSSQQSRSLSDGDILNTYVNAIQAECVDPNPERWMITQGMIKVEIKKVKRANATPAARP